MLLTHDISLQTGCVVWPGFSGSGYDLAADSSALDREAKLFRKIQTVLRTYATTRISRNTVQRGIGAVKICLAC